MLTLHHLNNSRSQRILWLLEELGTPYEMKTYQRNAETRLAPPELKAVHPLGKSPVITDGDITIAESGAIVDYIIRSYGKGAMMPAPGAPTTRHITSGCIIGRLGDAAADDEPLCVPAEGGRRAAASADRQRMANHLGYVDGALKGREFFVGPSLTGADIQMSFVGEMAKVFGKLEPYPNLDGLAGADARPAGVQAERREGRGVSVCVTILSLPACRRWRSCLRRAMRSGNPYSLTRGLTPGASPGRRPGDGAFQPHHILHKYQP